MIGICGEPLWRKLINMHPKDPSTGRAPPEATARVMIIGGILAPIGQLAFSWTCLPATIHWAVPIAFGIPFGCGNALSFIYGVSHLSTAKSHPKLSYLGSRFILGSRQTRATRSRGHHAPRTWRQESLTRDTITDELPGKRVRHLCRISSRRKHCDAQRLRRDAPPCRAVNVCGTHTAVGGYAAWPVRAGHDPDPYRVLLVRREN